MLNYQDKGPDKMTYVCIKCGRRWVRGVESEELSGGLCDKCITKYVRKKQIENGFHDCFARNIEECTEDCKYSEICNNILLNQ